MDILSFELDTSVIEKFVLRIFLFDSIILITVDGDVANTIIQSLLWAKNSSIWLHFWEIALSLVAFLIVCEFVSIQNT